MTDTQVAIVGAGPAGLLLSHLLAHAGIESIVVDSRSRHDIESTVRAGLLEHGTVQVLVDSGASDRVLVEGQRHGGIELLFGGRGHRIDFAELVDRGVWLYPQHEVLKDLVAARLSAGQDLRFETAVTDVDSVDSDVSIRTIGADGSPGRLTADFVVGADGSRSVVRAAVCGSVTSGCFREYPFAWFGILCEAPRSSEELIYSNSPHGFALITQRSSTVQRMYLQCDPDLDSDALSDEEIWGQLRERVAPHELIEGRIFQRDVLRFRSFVADRLRRGRVALAGDAAHTVPPTGAKGLNLAVADVVVLTHALTALLRDRDQSLIDAYEETVSGRIWKAQHFSWWMTQMLHTATDASAFDQRRQLGELQTVVDSESGRRYLAEAYTGWPMPEL
ncbi:MAG TPA: 4-hydroxybenzoate 3-monooxygenase [Solirubrobacteraceae bacterium]|nr:4-hydroxybenzoate 3-monooxygenase [Solirubrobacteraceae bacterium]